MTVGILCTTTEFPQKEQRGLVSKSWVACLIELLTMSRGVDMCLRLLLQAGRKSCEGEGSSNPDTVATTDRERCRGQFSKGGRWWQRQVATAETQLLNQIVNIRNT